MEFKRAMETVSLALAATGTTINPEAYDGLIVKKLETSNTLDEDRTTNQTHIAITGSQMDIFPYLRADGYFNEEFSDQELKKYFVTRIPVVLYESNISYLDEQNARIHFDAGEKKTCTSVVRSKRSRGSDQIQISLLNFDAPDFVSFRRLLHTGYYLLILKRLQKFEYDVFGIIPGKGIVDDGGLQNLNNLFFKLPTNTAVDVDSVLGTNQTAEDIESSRISVGRNILLYGVPGSGKSWTIEHEYCQPNSIVERLVFHPDYTNADFIGQILPVVDDEKQVTYEFTEGPFTTIVKNAYENPTKEYILIIEEINRGNAPAIFGEVFQLLDRTAFPKEEDGVIYQRGTSEYGITHKYMAEKIYGDSTHKVRIPSNLSIIGTMNTSDQNVFTLDTAFQRRWRMRLIENNFDSVRDSLSEAEILDTGITWRSFCEKINGIIIENKAKMASAEDKRLGVYFVNEDDLAFDECATPSEGYDSITIEYDALLQDEEHNNMDSRKMLRLNEIREALMQNRIFPEKVIKYLWDDAFKFYPEAMFDTVNMKSLEQVIRRFVYSKGRDRFKIFNKNVYSVLYPDMLL